MSSRPTTVFASLRSLASSTARPRAAHWRHALLAATCAAPLIAQAAVLTVSITDTAGTRAKFPNFDTMRHQIYSFSAIKPVELKLYAGIPNAAIPFDKPGIGVLGCNIHDTMAAWVVAVDTPWFGRSGADGRARIDAAPADSYELLVWHPGLPPNSDPLSIPVTIAAADAEARIPLPVSAEP